MSTVSLSGVIGPIEAQEDAAKVAELVLQAAPSRAMAQLTQPDGAPIFVNPALVAIVQ
jgi:hypothetical protein